MSYYTKERVLQIYEAANNLIGDEPVYFLNHGFYPAHKLVEDLPFRHQLSLYLHLLEGVETSGKSILDVGCGRGGPTDWISKNLDFSSVDGCDLSPINIANCERDNAENVTYKVSDAEDLQYESGTFDIVINVESSHCYQNFPKFVSEVQRVLKPNGLLLLADLRCVSHRGHNHCSNTEVTTDSYLKKFKHVVKRNITQNVSEACYMDSVLFESVLPPSSIRNTLISLANEKYQSYVNEDFGFFSYTCSQEPIGNV
jgi:ubiquinone/menaquinone biosynthesis C-methylase UbiE